MFLDSPTSVWVPVMSYVAPSPATKPSPPTVMSVWAFFTSAVPSYAFSPSAEVRVTLRVVMVSFAVVVATFL